jgi:Domain of unknown function (DUF4352)
LINTPAPPQRQISPDGQYEWDGTAWQPNQSPPPPPVGNLPPPKKKGHGVRNAAIVIGLLLLGTVVAVASNSGSSKPTATPVATAKPAVAAATAKPAVAAATAKPAAAPARDGSCSPQPCANDNYGWIVNVSSLVYGAASSNEFIQPEAGNVYVTMNVTFTNKTGSSQTANPYLFKLTDGAGVSHNITFNADCPSWSQVDIAAGSAYGPKCMVFEAVAGKPTGMTLDWTPSGLGGDYKIKVS